MLIILMAMSLTSPLLSRGQSVPTAESPAPARIYHLLREDDDWSFLADPEVRQDFWDRIKYIPPRSGRNGWFLSTGGEAREIWEQIGNDNWGQQPFMNGYFNERYMLYFDVHYGKPVRSFVELKSGLSSYRIGGPRPIDEKSSISSQHSSKSERGIFLIIPAGKSDARFVGLRPGTEVRCQANRHLWFQADYGIFYAGKFVKESQPGRNLNYWALWTGYKF
jgi:hypothetical protein